MFETDEHGAARRSDPGTSHEAAEAMDPSLLQGIVLAELRAVPDGLTILEISERTRIGVQTISPRFAPLRRKKLIYDTWLRRRNTTGRRAIVWRLQSLLDSEIDKLIEES